jgi:hypothetical protein
VKGKVRIIHQRGGANLLLKEQLPRVVSQVDMAGGWVVAVDGERGVVVKVSWGLQIIGKRRRRDGEARV